MPTIDALTPRYSVETVTWCTTRGEVRLDDIGVGYFRRSAQCESARGPTADQHGKVMKLLKSVGSILEAD